MMGCCAAVRSGSMGWQTTVQVFVCVLSHFVFFVLISRSLLGCGLRALVCSLLFRVALWYLPS